MMSDDRHAALIRALPLPVALWQRRGEGAEWVLRAASAAADGVLAAGLQRRLDQGFEQLFEADSGADVRACRSLRGRAVGDRPWLVRPLPLDADSVALLFEGQPDAPPPADLAFSTLRFEALLERAFDGIFVRREDKLVYLNPALLSLLGYERADELIGRSVLTFIHPEHHPMLLERVRSTDRGQGSEPPICVRCVRKDGKSIWLDGAGMPAQYQNEWAYLVLVRDVTARREEELSLRMTRETLGARLDVKEQELEQARLQALAEAEMRRRAEEELRQAQKMDAVGRLAGGIAHDFNNLLSVILAHASVLSRSLEPEDPRRASAQEVLAAGQRAADLTRQLLALSRRQVLEPRVVDLHSIVERMMSMLGRLVGESIDISCQLGASACSARLDPTQLEQVILNLVVNARDAMPEGGRLTIATQDEVLGAEAAEAVGLLPGKYVALSVSDTGVGMDEETRGRIFEPFFTTKELGRGTGLGLSTAHGIVRQSGGAIGVETAPGQGARFVVRLPAVAARPPSGERARVPAAATGSETILVAEDDAAVRRAIGEVLTSAGYRVLLGATGADALSVAQGHAGAIHLLVTDLVMPGMTGLELAQEVAARHPQIRVLVLSGYSRQNQLPATMHFLAKPFTEEQLLREVREVLGAPAAAALEEAPAQQGASTLPERG